LLLLLLVTAPLLHSIPIVPHLTLLPRIQNTQYRDTVLHSVVFVIRLKEEFPRGFLVHLFSC